MTPRQIRDAANGPWEEQEVLRKAIAKAVVEGRHVDAAMLTSALFCLDTATVMSWDAAGTFVIASTPKRD